MDKKALHIPPLSVQAKGKSMQNRLEEQVFLRDGYVIRQPVITLVEVTQVWDVWKKVCEKDCENDAESYHTPLPQYIKAKWVS